MTGDVEDEDSVVLSKLDLLKWKEWIEENEKNNDDAMHRSTVLKVLTAAFRIF